MSQQDLSFVAQFLRDNFTEVIFICLFEYIFV